MDKEDEIKNKIAICKKVIQYQKEYYEHHFNDLNIVVNNDIDFEPELDNLKYLLNSINSLYIDAHKSMSLALSFNKIAEELKDKSKILYIKCKFDERNYYFTYFIHQYFSILDHILFILNISAKLKIPENEVTMKKVDSEIKKIENYREFDEIWKQVLAIHDSGDKLLYNTLKHRYMLGIDYLSIPWKKLLINGNKTTYSLNNKPEIKFDKYSVKYQEKLNVLYKLFRVLWRLPRVKEIVKVNEKDIK